MPRRQNKEDTYHVQQSIMAAIFRLFSQNPAPGLTATIPLTIISFSLALVIAVVAALVQFANIQGLKQIARFYIWIFRGTPLLVQLFVVFFGLSRVASSWIRFPLQSSSFL